MSTDTTAAPTHTTPQVAVNDIGSEEDFLAAIDQTIKYFNDGDIVEGTIVKVDRDEVLLDIGYKTEGVIPSRELSIKHDVDPAEVVSVGEFVEALVLQKEDKEGRLILSKKRAQYERAWGTIEELKEKDEPVEGTVIEVVKGGLILDIGLRGFLPASLVEMRRVRDLQPYVGRKIEAKIIELDKNRNNVVLSRRAWLEQTQSEVRSEFLNQLARGQVRKGVVSSVVNFGAFVDLGGVDGLVHVSELSWKHIDHPSEVVEVGQEVTVEVLDVDLDRERVSLSLKATQEDPWRLYARTHAIGQIVPGKVTKLVPFGAFVRVEEGIEGLVHISELAERHVEIPEQVVQVGDDAMVKVIDIDLDRRRISLSLKQANEGMTVETEFDPTRYGMAAEYDDQGNYIYPEGFDVDTGDWQEGFEAQREAWEKEYAEAQARYEQHMTQIRKTAEADAEAAAEGPGTTSYSSGGWRHGAVPRPSPAARSPATSSSRPCARSSPAAPEQHLGSTGGDTPGDAVAGGVAVLRVTNALRRRRSRCAARTPAVATRTLEGVGGGVLRTAGAAVLTAAALLVAGCSTPPPVTPVPDFAMPSATGQVAAPGAPDGSIPTDCNGMLAVGDLNALLGLPIGSVSVRTTLGVPEPSVGRTQRVACRYSLTPAHGSLLDLNAARYADAAAAAKQWSSTPTSRAASAATCRSAPRWRCCSSAPPRRCSWSPTTTTR
jgi:small subunit ribosomal protein S1